MHVKLLTSCDFEILTAMHLYLNCFCKAFKFIETEVKLNDFLFKLVEWISVSADSLYYLAEFSVTSTASCVKHIRKIN